MRFSSLHLLSLRTLTKGGKRYGFPPLDTSFPLEYWVISWRTDAKGAWRLGLSFPNKKLRFFIPSLRTHTKGGKRYGFPPLDTSFPF